MPESKNSETERSEESPIVALRHNKKFLMTCFSVMIIGFLYAIFGAVVPVLYYGSYDAVCAPHNKGLIDKIIFFYMALFSTPFWIFVFFLGVWRLGKYEFFDDRLEVITYLSRRVVFP